MRILLIESEGDLLQLMGLILKDSGYRVVCLTTPQEAIRVVGRHEFDLVVTDLTVVGKRWDSFIRAIHRKNQNIPVLVITWDWERKKIQDMPVLTKPFDIETLVQTISGLVKCRRIEKIKAKVRLRA